MAGFPVSQQDHLLELLHHGLDQMGLSLNAHQCDALINYLALLVEWNQRMNLTGHDKPERMVAYHLLDSLSLIPYLKGKRIIDVGTGAGLPGIPLAIAAPDLSFCLLDSRLKRIQFVRHVCWQLDIESVKAVESRMESFSDQAGFDTIVARAVAEASSLMKDSRHLLVSDGQWALMKGSLPPEEQESIGQVHQVIRVSVPGIDHVRQIVVIPNSAP